MGGRTVRRGRAALLLLLISLSGCAGTPDDRESVLLSPGENAVALKAGNFSFSPGAITARAGEKLLLLVENASGSEHNLTVEDPDGRTLRSVDLPGREKIAVEIFLEKDGVYQFYCDLPYHRTLGMKGRITALPR